MKLERSEVLQRKIRQDEGAALVTSTWDEVRKAIRERRIDDALEGLEYACWEATNLVERSVSLADDGIKRVIELGGEEEAKKVMDKRDEPIMSQWPTWQETRAAIKEGRLEDALADLDACCAKAKRLHDKAVSYADDGLTRVAQLGGEQEVADVYRKRYTPVIKNWLETTPGVKELMEREAEFQRGHFGHMTFLEDDEKFTVLLDACGTGGQLRRTKDVARVQTPRDWTWHKQDVPVYCSHCAVMFEILPTEMRGYPIHITLPPKKDGDHCTRLYYKNPANIPEEYFTRISRPRGEQAMVFHPPQKKDKAA